MPHSMLITSVMCIADLSPRGTVIAADVFSSGIILSDTDFGQFEEYLNVSGLDVGVLERCSG